MKQNYILATALLFTFINLIAQTTDVVTGLNGPTQLEFNGTDLYISEFDGNKVSKIDISQTTPTLIDVVTGLNNPVGLAINGTDLYIAEFSENKISKVDLNSLTIEDFSIEKKVKLYPNPTARFLQVSGLTKTENYSIYNVLGTKIMSSVVSNKEYINIENLTNGLYFLKFENGNTLKFIKE